MRGSAASFVRSRGEGRFGKVAESSVRGRARKYAPVRYATPGFASNRAGSPRVVDGTSLLATTARRVSRRIGNQVSPLAG